jgi:glucose/arabinose dehydrogenase
MKVRGAILILAVVAAGLPAAVVPAGGEGIPVLGVQLTRVGATFQQPLALAVRAGDTRIFIAEKTGRVKTLTGTLILDLSAEVLDDGEGGLLGLAFSPDGAFMYVTFTDRPNHRIHVTSFGIPGGVVNLASRREILVVDHPSFTNHFGGGIVFGPDGYLYIGLGDGGGGGDPFANGQNLGALLGKLLRIAPHPERTAPPFYDSPSTNPFLTTPGARPEIWSYGLRNPWRFSFDRLTGDIWIGDVGQNLWEEVDFRVAGSPGGENYGWNEMEGNHPYLTGTEPANHVRPIYEYPHGADCSITGGYVYRGTAIPTLEGRYIFTDFCNSRLRALFGIAGLINVAIDLNVSASSVTSFGEDATGELYAMSFGGGVFRLDPA